MKPEQLSDGLKSISAIMQGRSNEIEDSTQREVTEKVAKISAERDRLKVLKESGSLSAQDMAVKYAESLIAACHINTAGQNITFTPEITFDNVDVEGFGKSKIVGFLTAHAKNKSPSFEERPENGGAVAGYSLVVAIVPEKEMYGQPELTAFLKSDEQVKLKAKMIEEGDEPAYSHGLVDVQTIKMDGNVPVVSADFLDWAVNLYDKITVPENAPTFYYPDDYELA